MQQLGGDDVGANLALTEYLLAWPGVSINIKRSRQYNRVSLTDLKKAVAPEFNVTTTANHHCLLVLAVCIDTSHTYKKVVTTVLI